MVINNRLTSLQFPRCPLITNDYETTAADLTLGLWYIERMRFNFTLQY